MKDSTITKLADYQISTRSHPKHQIMHLRQLKQMIYPTHLMHRMHLLQLMLLLLHLKLLMHQVHTMLSVPGALDSPDATHPA